MMSRTRIVPLLNRFGGWANWPLLLLALGIFAAPGCTDSPATSAAKPGTVDVSAEKQRHPAEDDAADDAPEEAPAADPVEAKSADDVLQQMAAAYANAQSYRDRGQIQVRFTPLSGDQESHQEMDCAVAFERPNKTRLKVYSALVVSDGELLHATIDDQRFEGDVLEFAAPEKLRLEDLLKDAVLGTFLTQGVAGMPVQMVLLLGEKPLEAMLDSSEKVSLLPPERLDNRWHHKVKVDRLDGALIFWVDQQSHALRRLEYPTEEMKKQMAAEGRAGEVSLVADFRKVQLNGRVPPSVFGFDVPAKGKVTPRFNVNKFEEPPPAPSQLLGQKVPDFTLTDLEGKQHTLESLAGKVVVLDFWATWCEPCMASLPNVGKVHKKFADNDQVVFLAVSVDDPSIGDDDLRARFEQLKVNVKIARCEVEPTLKAFGIVGLPNLVVLGPDGVMQDDEPGLNMALATELPKRLEKLLAGESLHEEAQARYDRQLTEYHRKVSELPDEPAAGDPPVAEIAPHDEPQNVKLTKLWSCGELTEPGNILIVPSEGGSPKILVHDGWRHVVELNAEGQTVARHELKDVPSTAGTSCLRTAVDGKGKRYYLALASAQQQIFLFDDEWQPLLTYPKEVGHEGVADALLADLDGDKELELYVSYWGIVGVQRASLDGQKKWAYREQVEKVYALAVTSPNAEGVSQLLCANGHEPGWLELLDSYGQEQQKIVVANQHLYRLAAADLNGDGETEYAGVAPSPTGAEVVVGFDLAGNELWTQPLAKGNHQSLIEMLSVGRLLPGDAAHWLAASPDGGILFIAADGQLADSFHYGTALHGLAAAEINGARVLIVSTPQKVEAWKVEP